MHITEDETKRKIIEINKKWYVTAAKDHNEESTIQNFIYPLLEALGWDLETDLKREVNRIDLVLCFENRPYVGIEAKSLSYGVLEENKGGVNFNKERLMRNCRQIGVKYAAVSRYKETRVFDMETGKIIVYFNNPNEYVERFKDLEVLKKPSC